MQNNLRSAPEKVQIFAVVRDKHGMPRFDDIHGIHPRLWAMLTENEQQEIRKNGGYPAH